MKAKNKMIALLEIAIVLCLVFLVTLPAIAAEQNQEMQKVASTITTASEDDYVLGVYGNANEDDTIDMRDLTYVKLIFFGKKPETELSDAKYDGKLNPLDFIQIKLIIVGKEKEITIVDSADRIVTVKKPVKRIVSIGEFDTEAIRVLGAKDKIVGVYSGVIKKEVYFPYLSKLPSVGTSSNPDLEVIFSLNPDLLTTYKVKAADLDEKLPGIPVVGLDCYKPETLIEELEKLGYIIDKEDEAKHYSDDFHDKCIDFIKARTEGLSEEERLKVYVEGSKDYQTYGGTSGTQQLIGIPGGRNIFADIGKGTFYVDPEDVVMKNPDIIIKNTFVSAVVGYEVDDPSEAAALRENIMHRPELAKVGAVENGRVYILAGEINYGCDYPIAIAYWAKWFYPALFEGVNPQELHQEYIDEFIGIDFDVSKHGVFVYPPQAG